MARAAQDPRQFVCYLRYVDATGQPLWFRENASGSDIVAMARAQFRTFAASAVAYERRRLPPGRPADLFQHGATLASSLQAQAQAQAQPRVVGTACDGSYGVENATPTASILTPGNYRAARD